MDCIFKPLKESKLYGPLAILSGHFLILVLQSAASCVLCIDGELYSRGIVATFLAAAYVYSWTVGNPHAAVPTENKPIYEVAVVLTAGFYATKIFYTNSCCEAVLSIMTIMAATGALTDGIGGNVFSTYSFLSEVGTLLFLMRCFASKCRHPTRPLLEIFYPVVHIGARTLAQWHLTYMLVTNTNFPIIQKIEMVIITLCNLCFVQDIIDNLKNVSGRPPRGSSESFTVIAVRPKKAATRACSKIRTTVSKKNIRSRSKSRSRTKVRC